MFRRNIGAEVSLFSQTPAPGTVLDWFTLLQTNRLLGLIYLDVFDLIDYALVGLMFLALYAALRRANLSAAAIATACGLLGIAVYFASNTAFSMLSLSNQYAAVANETQRSILLAAGQALLTSGSLGDSSGIYISLCLVAIAGLLVSIAMLRSPVFGKWTVYMGILASALDLVYCIAFPFVPVTAVNALALSTIPAAGLFWMIWHILVGLKLLRLER
jgi:hypothetical protein